MSSRYLMQGSAQILFVLGAIGLFFPDLVMGDVLSSAASVPIQLFGGALLAFAFLNWMGRRAILGGVYGRPIVVANFGLGVITAGTLTSATLDGRLPDWGWALVTMFTLHAVGFFWLMRRPPWESGAKAESHRGSV